MAKMKVPKETKILNDDEVRFLNEALTSQMSEKFRAAFLKYGINPEDTIRLRSLAATFRNARVSWNESVKETSTKLKIPQYKIKDIESGDEEEIEPASLRMLSSYFCLDTWCARWARMNQDLAYRLGMDEWLKIGKARRGEGKKDLPDYHMQEVERQVGRFVESIRPPEHKRPQVDIGCRITGQSFMLFEIRPEWDHPEVTEEIPVAKATYVKSRSVWKLYCMRADLKWHRYELPQGSESLRAVLNEIAEDPWYRFWG